MASIRLADITRRDLAERTERLWRWWWPEFCDAHYRYAGGDVFRHNQCGRCRVKLFKQLCVNGQLAATSSLFRSTARIDASHLTANAVNGTEPGLNRRVFRLKPIDCSAIKRPFALLSQPCLRQALHALSIYSAVLAEKPTQDTLREVGQSIHQIVRSLGSLLNGLLDLSKLSVGNYVVDRQVLALDRLVAEVCTEFHTAAKERGLNFSQSLAAPAIGGVASLGASPAKSGLRPS